MVKIVGSNVGGYDAALCACRDEVRDDGLCEFWVALDGEDVNVVEVW